MGALDYKPPQLDLYLEKDQTLKGGIFKGELTMTGVDYEYLINSIEISLLQINKNDESDIESIGSLSIPYLNFSIQKDQILKEPFIIQNDCKDLKNDDNFKYKIEIQICNNSDECSGIERDIEILDKESKYIDMDLNNYLYLSNEVDLLHSSVRGELRITGFSKGFITSWNDRISMRDNQGKLKWKINGPGRSVAISPDEKSLAVSWPHESMLSFYNLESGELIQEHTFDMLIDHLVWYRDNKSIIAAGNEKDIIVLDNSGNLVRSLKCKGVEWIDSLIEAPEKDMVYLSDTNTEHIWMVDTKKDKTKKMRETYCTGEMALSPDKKTLVSCDSLRSFEVFKAKKVKPVFESDIPGKTGMRYPGMEADCRAWDAKVRFHPNNEEFLINVRDGQLWIINIIKRTKEPVTRKHVNFVEDSHWINENIFAAIDSFGYVTLVDREKQEVIFREPDYEEE